MIESGALASTPDEKGNLPSYLDGVFSDARDGIKPGGRFYGMFDAWNAKEMRPRKVFGKEVSPKAASVHSSSMLAYNFFHWISPEHPLHFSDGVTYDKVYFKLKMPMLKSDSHIFMDVVLVSEDCRHMLCFASFFTELLNWRDAIRIEKPFFDWKSYGINPYAKDFVKCVKEINLNSDYRVSLEKTVKCMIAVSNLQYSNYAMTDMLVSNGFIDADVAKNMQNGMTVRFSNLLYLFRNNLEEKHYYYNSSHIFIKGLSNFREASHLDEMVWECLVLPNYAYNYCDMLAIMRYQMPDRLADYLVARYPDLQAF